MSIDDERKAAAKAQTVLSQLVPSTPRTDEIIFTLRYAAGLASNANAKGLSSQAELNNTRGDAATTLNAVAGLVDARKLTREMIDHARRAVAAWWKALDSV